MAELKIVRNEEAIHVVKENKTAVNYFIFNEYEIHLNKIPPHSIQEWHYHRYIEEVILVTKGELICKWLNHKDIIIEKIMTGDLVQVKDSIHTFENVSDNDCEFIVFRLVLEGKDKREMIKQDKKVVELNDK